MNCRISDMRCKEVINIMSGERMGYIYDVMFSAEMGKITAVIIQGESRLFGIFGKDDDIIIPWECVKKVSSDIVLVDFKENIKVGGRSV